MSEETRQSKLAAAKKKLRDYQQRNSSPAGLKKKKKKTKHGTSPKETTSDGCEAPEDVPNEPEILLSIPTDDDTTSPGVTAPSNSDIASAQNCDAGHDWSVRDNKAFSSTKDLRQLCHELNGLASEPVSYTNGSDQSSLNIKTLESRYQELATALDASNHANKHLTTKIEELEQQNQKHLNQLEKDKKEHEQKLAREQSVLREQLQVHIQTIGILVSEKSELQTALVHTQQAVRQKAGESEDLAGRLQLTRQRMGELERTLSSVSTQQKQAEKSNKELIQERDNLRIELYKNKTLIEDLKQCKSEMGERLRYLMMEKGDLQVKVEELQKQLEMSELLLVQFKGPSKGPSDQQEDQGQKEQARPDFQVEHLKELLKQLTVERDLYAKTLTEDKVMWEEKMQQVLEQMRTVKEEKEQSLRRVQELETDLAELKNQIAAPPAPEPPAGPSEIEQQLRADAQLLQKEVETLTDRLQSTIQENIELTLSNQEQSLQLRQLERMAESRKEDAESRTKVLEEIKNSRTTISRAMCQNLELKKQLAELQDSFVKMSNESMETTSSLISEQHAKSLLAKRLGELQEKLADLTDTIEEKSRESQELQQQRDQYLSQLQQQVAASQRLASDRDELEKRVQLLEQLQQQSKSHAEQACQKLQETQGHLETVNEQKQQLQAELQLLTVTVEGEGLNREEEASQPSLRVPEDLDGRESIVAFCNSALASAEQEQVRLRRELREQKLLCQRLAHLAAASEHQREEVEAEAASRTRTDSVPGETHQALQAAMEKLQGRFTEIMQEKADLKERVEELEHRCIQLSEETDTIGEYIALYQSQRALLRKRQREKEECLSRVASEKEDMKVKLSALQQLVVQLMEERKEHQGKLPAVKQSPAEAAPIEPPAHQEVDAARAPVSPETSAQPAQGAPGQTPAPAAQQIMQLLNEIQSPKERVAFTKVPCIPFFYRADDNAEVKIMVV